jgi:hypothetical protein
MEAAATPHAAKPKARRRWLSFSLRTLLIFVTLAGCGFGWLGLKFQEARRQQAIVAAIEKLDGWVQYDYQLDSQGDYKPNATPPGPAWLHSLLGDDFFRTVYSVGAWGFLVSGRQDRPFRDTDLEFVEGLTTLKVLVLFGTQVSDAGLANLKGLTRLEELYLDYTHVSDAGLDYLKGLTQLKNLDLCGTQVTDAGLANLKGLTRLEKLGLSYTHVSDVGLDYLKGLTQLKHLSLNRTQVSDGGVAKLQQALPNCKISH